ncbi:MAG: glycoside hydrolase family 127 protein [Planctomycetota bacterium]|nr:glycoside hydrolase family 127 protein [Planctomycetota bacterium]
MATSTSTSTPSRRLRSAEVSKVRFDSGFWADRQRVNREATLPIQYFQCKTTGRIDALKLEWKQGDPNPPHIFWESDVAKWIEAAAYSLAAHKDPSLESLVDQVVDLLAGAQQPDGYLNVHYTVVNPGKRWTNLRDCHELYCAGHLIEAAVAYDEATGKGKLLGVMCKYVDYIATLFGPGEGRKRGYCGHEEIELALVKLARWTKQQKYMDLARYFVDERGATPHYFDIEAVARGETVKPGHYGNHAYCQAHKPVREQGEVVGHAVRAMYLYTAMADLAGEIGDAGLLKACHALWDDLVNHKLYITGGIGPSAHNEGFTTAFDLPNESAYAETCAAIGLVFWAQRLAQVEPDSRYTDVLETCLYNGTISGVSLDGKKFFYVNPLESRGKHHRQEWFGCACCPPNISRMIGAVGEQVYATGKDSLYVHLYAQTTAELMVGETAVRVEQRTEYPWDGKVTLKLGLAAPAPPVRFTLALRIPGWCRSAKLRVNGRAVALKGKVKNGYAHVKAKWADGDVVQLDLAMPVERVEARPEVRMDAGRVALRRGPMIYCLEQVDNGGALNEVSLPRKAKLTAKFEPRLLGGVCVIEGKAERRSGPKWGGELYRAAASRPRAVKIRAVPYFAWDNRAAGEMMVWVREG